MSYSSMVKWLGYQKCNVVIVVLHCIFTTSWSNFVPTPQSSGQPSPNQFGFPVCYVVLFCNYSCLEHHSFVGRRKLNIK